MPWKNEDKRKYQNSQYPSSDLNQAPLRHKIKRLCNAKPFDFTKQYVITISWLRDSTLIISNFHIQEAKLSVSRMFNHNYYLVFIKLGTAANFITKCSINDTVERISPGKKGMVIQTHEKFIHFNTLTVLICYKHQDDHTFRVTGRILP
jgi:hypothetical protein